jgi:glycosyltransferase involved in cell wall biosynthesis
MIVIATNNGNEDLPRLLDSLEKYNYNNFPICIVDTGSTNEEFINYLEELKTLNKYTIFNIKGGYDTGAYIHAYKNTNSDYYIFLQDSTEIKHEDFFKKLEEYSDKGCIFAFYIFADPDSVGDFTQILEKYYDAESMANYQFGIFGPMFATSREVLDLIYNNNLYLIPTNKVEQMAMERGWAIAAYKLGILVYSFDMFNYSNLANDVYHHFRKYFHWGTEKNRE